MVPLTSTPTGTGDTHDGQPTRSSYQEQYVGDVGEQSTNGDPDETMETGDELSNGSRTNRRHNVPQNESPSTTCITSASNGAHGEWIFVLFLHI